MTRRYWLTAVALGGCLALFLPLIGLAGDDEPVRKGKNAEMGVPELLVLASKLEAYGLREKSPYALIAAGELFLQVKKGTATELTDIQEEVKDDGTGEEGDPAPKPTKAKEFAEEAEELFEQALNYSKPGEKALIESCIKNIKENTRGAVNGPRTLNRGIGGHKTQTIQMTFRAHQVAHVGFRAHSGVPLHIHVSGPGINAQDLCLIGNATWIPPKKASYLIKIHNPHKRGAQYTVWVN